MADMYRKHPEMAVRVLNQCLEDGDKEALLMTFRHLAKLLVEWLMLPSCGIKRNVNYTGRFHGMVSEP